MGLTAVVFALAWLPAAAQTPAEVEGLVPGPPLGQDIEALPRLADRSAVADRINAQLDEMDAATQEWAVTCRQHPQDWYQRWVTVTFTGPEFLGLTIHENQSCNRAFHPNVWIKSLTLDLATAEELDWLKVIGPGLAAEGPNRFSLSELEVTDRMVGFYLEAAPTLPEDCRAEIAVPPVYLQFALMAEGKGVAIWPTSLPYSMQACADPVILTADQLERQGWDARIIAALRASGG